MAEVRSFNDRAIELSHLRGKNPGNVCLWNPEYSSRNTEAYQRLESRIQAPLTETKILYLEWGSDGVESTIQDCHGFPYMGRQRGTTHLQPSLCLDRFVYIYFWFYMRITMKLRKEKTRQSASNEWKGIKIYLVLHMELLSIFFDLNTIILFARKYNISALPCLCG